MNNYTIWITYHKEGLAEQYHCKNDGHHKLYPVYCPAELEDINYMHNVWSEMVAMWYVWKHNVYSPYVGFNHYRRQFDVKRLPAKGECQVHGVIDFGRETVYTQYARCHSSADMDTMLRIVAKRYGDNNPYKDKIIKSHKMVYACCFLMAWEDFNALCEFLFPLIQDFSEATGCGMDANKWRRKAVQRFGEQRADYQTRCVGYLCERLISAWIMTHLRPYEQKDIAIVHFNTPELTAAAVKSIRKNSPGCDITIFDNSDKRPFVPMDGVAILDNTKGQIIDFDAFLAKYPNKVKSVNNWGSPKHIRTIEYLWGLFPNNFLLMDSDVLVKRDLSPFFVRFPATCAWVGEIHFNPTNNTTPRLLPYCLWMNTRLCGAYGVHFFAEDRCDKLVAGPPWHDTGASFWEDCNAAGLKGRQLPIGDYIEHLAMGSFNRTDETTSNWLTIHKDLWSF